MRGGANGSGRGSRADERLRPRRAERLRRHAESARRRHRHPRRRAQPVERRVDRARHRPEAPGVLVVVEARELAARQRLGVARQPLGRPDRLQPHQHEADDQRQQQGAADRRQLHPRQRLRIRRQELRRQVAERHRRPPRHDERIRRLVILRFAGERRHDHEIPFARLIDLERQRAPALRHLLEVLVDDERQLSEHRQLRRRRQHAPAQEERHVDVEHALHRLRQLAGHLLSDDERARVVIARDHRRRRHAVELAADRPGVVAAIAAQRIGDERKALDPVLVDRLVEPGARDHPPARVGGPHEVHLHLVVEVAQPLLHGLVHEPEVGRTLGRLLERLDEHRVRRHLRRRVDPLARVDLEQQRRRMLRAFQPRAGLVLEIALHRPRGQKRHSDGEPAHQRDQQEPCLRPEHQGLAPVAGAAPGGAGAGTCTLTSLVRPETSIACVTAQRSR